MRCDLLVRLLSDQVAAPRSILQLIPTGTMKQIANSSVLREELAEKSHGQNQSRLQNGTIDLFGMPTMEVSLDGANDSFYNQRRCSRCDVEQAVPPKRQQIVLSPPSLELLVCKSIDAFFDNDLFLATRLFMNEECRWIVWSHGYVKTRVNVSSRRSSKEVDLEEFLSP